MRLNRVYAGTPIGSLPKARFDGNAANPAILDITGWHDQCQWIELEGNAAHHVIRVLRLRVGQPLILFDGSDTEYDAVIKGMTRDSVRVSIAGQREVNRESPLAITLAQGVSRGERMDVVVQKATELGVRRIIPVMMERTVVKLDATQAEKRLRHWRAIAVAACEQCGRNRVPEIAPPVDLEDLLSSDSKSAPAANLRLVLDPGSRMQVRDLPPAPADVTLLIGPEGGLSDDELSAALKAGYQGLRLGPRILRTETAALAALTAIQLQLGDL